MGKQKKNFSFHLFGKTHQTFLLSQCSCLPEGDSVYSGSQFFVVALVYRQCYKTFREDIGEIKIACLTGAAKIGQLFIVINTSLGNSIFLLKNIIALPFCVWPARHNELF